MKNTFNFYQITMAILSNFQELFSVSLSHSHSRPFFEVFGFFPNFFLLFFIFMQICNLFEEISTFKFWRLIKCLYRKFIYEKSFERFFLINREERKWRNMIKLIKKKMNISSTITFKLCTFCHPFLFWFSVCFEVTNCTDIMIFICISFLIGFKAFYF